MSPFGPAQRFPRLARVAGGVTPCSSRSQLAHIRNRPRPAPEPCASGEAVSIRLKRPSPKSVTARQYSSWFSQTSARGGHALEVARGPPAGFLQVGGMFTTWLHPGGPGLSREFFVCPTAPYAVKQTKTLMALAGPLSRMRIRPHCMAGRRLHVVARPILHSRI